MVGADWDWCQRCGFDPDHLRPESAPIPAPAPAQAPARHFVGATPGGSGGLTTSDLVRLKRPTVAPPLDEPPVGSVAANGASSAEPEPAGSPAAALAPARRRRRRQWVLAAAVVVAIGIAAALVAHRATSATSRSGDLGTKLLSQADLPSRWAAIPPSNPLAGTGHGCLLAPPTGAGSDATQAAAGFRAAAGTPYLVERLEHYTPGAATARWNELLAKALNGCAPAASGATPSHAGGPRPLTVVARPREADASAAFTVPTAAGTVAVFMARVGGQVVTMAVVMKGPLDQALFDQAVSTAMTKLAR